jgi:SlyX protein
MSDDGARIDRLEMRLTEQDRAIEDLNRTITEQWRIIDRLTRQVAVLTEHVEEAAARTDPRGAPEPPPPHY